MNTDKEDALVQKVALWLLKSAGAAWCIVGIAALAVIAALLEERLSKYQLLCISGALLVTLLAMFLVFRMAYSAQSRALAASEEARKKMVYREPHVPRSGWIWRW
jgi:hypothetical protein